jgi:Protein of unknown function DUF58
MRLYRADRFVPHSQTYRVLPKFTAAGDATPNIKRLNAIPRQGIHRQQRAGVGFELLELREYLEGDPPKAIAWKASARRDKLMTRQYESEVPLRVQLIVDGTSSTRIGGFGLRLIDQITHASGSIAHSVTKVGDAIGAYLVDDQHIERVPASSGTIGFYALMRRLGDFSKNRNPPSRRLTPQLLESAYAVMSERFPDLLEPSINPIAMHWLRSFPRRGERQRIQLANAMAHIHGLSLNQQVNLMTDDSALAQRLAIFLSECGMPWIAPIAYPADADSFHSSERIHLLSKSILSAISNAHDNEVLVIIAELLGNDGWRKQTIRFTQIAGRIFSGRRDRKSQTSPSDGSTSFTNVSTPTKELERNDERCSGIENRCRAHSTARTCHATSEATFQTGNSFHDER